MTHKKTIAIIIVIVNMLLSSFTYSQIVENSCDTVNIEAPAYLVLNDTSIHVFNDSTAIICTKYLILTKKNGYSLYTKLLDKSKKHALVKKVFQLLIASGTQDTMLVKKALMEAEDAYVPYSGKIIRNIKIQVLKPIGPSISDTNLPVISTWAKAINASHISTRNRIIEHKLLFKVNDTINPLELVENTNELAGLPYLQDAAIVVMNSTTDSVDVLVLVKDKFPWLPIVTIYDINRMKFYLRQVNILGMGQSLGVGTTLDRKNTPLFYISDVNYYVNNIYNQISGAINFHVSDNNKTYQLLLNRAIMPLSVRLGGGLEIAQIEENIVTDPTDIDHSSYFFKYRYYELWSSYLFYDDTKHRKKISKNTYMIPGAAFYQKQYLDHPFVSIDSNSRFVNYTRMLTNIAFVQQNYYRTNYLRSFGKAEYIPYGFQVSVTSGYSWTEFMNKPYIGIGLAANKHINKFGYISADFACGTHFSNKLEQGAINSNLSFLTDIKKMGSFRYRLLTNLNYTDAINRTTDELLYLGEDYGFLGMNEKAWYGKQRLFLELNAITYTPWYLWGFRIAIYGFCSAGLLGTDEYSVLRNRLLSSVGIGFYMNNDFLAFDSFQVRVAYFPVTPEGISHFGISFSTLELFKQINFLNTKPHIVEYR